MLIINSSQKGPIVFCTEFAPAFSLTNVQKYRPNLNKLKYTVKESDSDQSQPEINAEIAFVWLLHVEICVEKSCIGKDEWVHIVPKQDEFRDEEIETNLVLVLAHYYGPTSYLYNVDLEQIYLSLYNISDNAILKQNLFTSNLNKKNV